MISRDKIPGDDVPRYSSAAKAIGYSPFLSRKEKEQAEAGRSPALLALRYRYGGFAYPPGILEAVFTREIKEKRILGSILYIWITI